MCRSGSCIGLPLGTPPRKGLPSRGPQGGAGAARAADPVSMKLSVMGPTRSKEPEDMSGRGQLSKETQKGQRLELLLTLKLLILVSDRFSLCSCMFWSKSVPTKVISFLATFSSWRLTRALSPSRLVR